VNVAKLITKDLDELSGLRQTLRDRLRASPLMNARQFATDLENAYAQIWTTYCEK